MTTEHIISAIIGFWRMGATFEQINDVTSIPISIIKEIIAQHESKSNDN